MCGDLRGVTENLLYYLCIFLAEVKKMTTDITYPTQDVLWEACSSSVGQGIYAKMWVKKLMKMSLW